MPYSKYSEIPSHFEVGAVLQHRPRQVGDVAAPPRILIVGRDDELSRWLAIDPEFTLISVYDGSMCDMYRRVRPSNFKNRITLLAEGKRLWARTLKGRKVSMRTP